MKHGAFVPALKKRLDIRFATMFIASSIGIGSCDLSGVAGLDGEYIVDTILLPNFLIDGSTVMYGNGVEEQIQSVTRALFEEVDPDTIVFDEYFLVHTDSSPSLLLRYQVAYVNVPTRGGDSVWVRNNNWGVSAVEEEDVDEWKNWLDEHGNLGLPRPGSDPPRLRFFVTRGPDREISPEDNGLVEIPVDSGRRIWMKR